MPVYHATKTGKLIPCDVTHCRTKHRLHIIAPDNLATVQEFIEYSELNLPEPLPLGRSNERRPDSGEETVVTVEIKNLSLDVFNKKKAENFLKFLSHRKNVTLNYIPSESGFKNINFTAPLSETVKFLKFFDTFR